MAPAKHHCANTRLPAAISWALAGAVRCGAYSTVHSRYRQSGSGTDRQEPDQSAECVIPLCHQCEPLPSLANSNRARGIHHLGRVWLHHLEIGQHEVWASLRAQPAYGLCGYNGKHARGELDPESVGRDLGPTLLRTAYPMWSWFMILTAGPHACHGCSVTRGLWTSSRTGTLFQKKASRFGSMLRWSPQRNWRITSWINWAVDKGMWLERWLGRSISTDRIRVSIMTVWLLWVRSLCQDENYNILEALFRCYGDLVDDGC